MCEWSGNKWRGARDWFLRGGCDGSLWLDVSWLSLYKSFSHLRTSGPFPSKTWPFLLGEGIQPALSGAAEWGLCSSFSFFPSTTSLSEPLDKTTFRTSENFGFLYQTGPFVFPERSQKSNSAFHKFVHIKRLLSWKILFLGHSYSAINHWIVHSWFVYFFVWVWYFVVKINIRVMLIFK